MITATERQTILSNMQTLLKEYDYKYTLDALNSIIDEWSEQKETLIEAFKKHPNYVEGKFLIAFSQDYRRDVDVNAAEYFLDWLIDVIRHKPTTDLPEEIYNQLADKENNLLPRDLSNAICAMRYYFKNITIPKEYADQLNAAIPQIHPRTGQKLSKVVNKLCTYLNYSQHVDYNKEFAKFADALSPLTIKRHTVLSLNPLDYLTMSFGNSWASCHTIDKENKRNMPNDYQGAYSSGTMSYMLDPSSMVFYTVDAGYDGTDYWTQPKINRQMFHYGEDKLVQGRLYPQCNDDDDAVYEPYRKIAQGIMATIFDYPNFWTMKRGSVAASKYIISYGTHYRDYEHFNTCTLSTIKDSANLNLFTVGATPICIQCGTKHRTQDNINCCADKMTCEHCGRQIAEDDGVWCGDNFYCCDCVTYCDMCGYCEPNCRVRYLDNYHMNVCDDCIDDNFVTCEECGEYVRDYDAVYDEETDTYYCRDCYENREDE